MHYASCVIAALALSLSACQSLPDAPAAKQDLAQIRTQIALEYLNTGQLGLAMQQVEMALAADPSYAKAIGVLASIHQHDGSVVNIQKARQLYERALAMDASDMALHHQYGVFLTSQNDHQAAIRHFGIAGEAIGYPDRVVALENLAYVRVEQVRIHPNEAEYRAAIDAIERAVQTGSQLGPQMRQALDAYWRTAHHTNSTN